MENCEVSLPDAQLTAVLVIDMLNDYLMPQGKLFSEHCRPIIPTLREFLQNARLHQWPVLYLNTSLNSPSASLAQRWGLHAQPGSWGSSVIDELRPIQSDRIILKSGYDGFFNTDLHQQLQELSIKRVVLTGIHTHVCILATALSAFQLGYQVVIIEDCISASSDENHLSRLPFFRSHVGEVITSRDLLGR